MQATPENTNECVGAYGATCGEPIPELKGVTRVTWSTGPFGVSLRHRFIDSVTTDRFVLPQRRGATPPAKETLTNPTLDAQNYLDLSFTFDFGDKAEIFATVNNVLDTDPPIIVGQGGYGNTYPGDLRLRGHDRVPGSQRQDVLIRRPAWYDRRRRKPRRLFFRAHACCPPERS